MSEYQYDNSLKIKDALELYFSKYHFANGGYDLKWFKIKLGPVYLPFPNTKARIEAVKIHDIHHVLTGYEAVLKGEAEIGAWELASGCGRYYMAWILNAGSFFYGMFFFPRALFKAFLKGRSIRSNLYYDTIYNEELLNKTVGELKEKLGILSPNKNNQIDYLLFLICCIVILSMAASFFYMLYIILLKINAVYE